MLTEEVKSESYTKFFLFYERSETFDGVFKDKCSEFVEELLANTPLDVMPDSPCSKPMVGSLWGGPFRF